MGYRSTFITNHIMVKFPCWFVEKWSHIVHFGEDNRLPISSKKEAKIYTTWIELEEDIQKVLIEQNKEYSIFLVWLGEDGAIEKRKISKDKIENFEL